MHATHPINPRLIQAAQSALPPLPQSAIPNPQSAIDSTASLPPSQIAPPPPFNQNALKHGAFSQATLLPTDDPEEFAQFQSAWLLDLNPQSAPQLYFAHRAISLAWRLQRLSHIESALYASLQTQHQQQVENIRKNQKDFPHFKDHPHFQAIFNHTNPTLTPIDLHVQAITDNELPNPFDQLTKTEDRLQSMLHRTLKQLHHLQHPKPPPNPQKSQNQPPAIPASQSAIPNPRSAPIEKSQNQPPASGPAIPACAPPDNADAPAIPARDPHPVFQTQKSQNQSPSENPQNKSSAPLSSPPRNDIPAQQRKNENSE